MAKQRTNRDVDTLARILSIPSGYCEFKLGMKLHPTQKRVLDSLFNGNKRKVSLIAGNSVGKSRYIICGAILYCLDILNGNCISTCATYRQISGQLSSALKQYAHLYPKWRFLESCISIDNIDRYVGFATSDQGKFQGWHSTEQSPLLLIVDEAAAIAKDIYEGAARCHPTYELVVGSPLGPEGEFYDIHTKPNFGQLYDLFRLPATECVKSKGYWIDDKELENMILRWGKSHPLVLSSVFAEFSSQSENSLISLSALDKCFETPPQLDITSTKRSVFIDVAAGGDSNVIALCKANRVSIVKKWKNKDTMAACGEILRELERMRKEINLKDTEVSIDADGLGIGIANRLQELGWKNINLFHGGSKPKSEEYLNAISEVWLTGIQKIQKCEIILPNDNDLKYQLLNRKLKIHSNGKLKLESKEDMKSRGVESPDVADAVLGAMYNHYSGFLTFAHALVPTNNIQSRANFS